MIDVVAVLVVEKDIPSDRADGRCRQRYTLRMLRHSCASTRRFRTCCMHSAAETRSAGR
jgi:hypothetical protein